MISNIPESALSVPDSSRSNNPNTYSISLPSDTTRFLEVEVDGNVYFAPLSKESASVTVPALDPDNHNVIIRYTGDNAKLSQNKDITALYSAKSTYNVLVTLDSKAGGVGENVVIKYNSKTYIVQTNTK